MSHRPKKEYNIESWIGLSNNHNQDYVVLLYNQKTMLESGIAFKTNQEV